MDNFLEEILQAEQGSAIKATREYVGTRKQIDTAALKNKTFKPSILFKSFVLIFIAGLIVLAIFKTFQPKKLTDSEIGGLIVLYISSFIIGANVIRQFFTDTAMNFIIRVDHSGISIDDTQYKWDNIYETAIMSKAGGNKTYKYLVIAMPNMSTYESYDLTNFVSLNPFGFGMTLAKYIEYFKPDQKI
jgi:uncharacterized membrane protein